MPVSYQDLPLHSIYDSVSEKTVTKHYQNLMHSFNSEQISILRKYHIGNFQLSGINHFMPEFMISDEAKQFLNYPQGFLIMEADRHYYTDRSGLDSFELRFSLEGEGLLTYRKRKYTIRPGEGYWIDCREPHFYKTSGDSWKSTIFHLNGQLVKTIFHQYASDDNVKFTAKTCPNFEMLQFQVLKESLKIAPYYEYRLSCMIDTLLTELLISKNAGSPSAPEKSCMPELITYIQEHYTQDITLETLMHSFGISRTALCTEFKNYTGFTVKKYILSLRINQAKQLLSYSTGNVSEIAQACGFHDTAYFIQTFKKNIGITPLQYRKKLYE